MNILQLKFFIKYNLIKNKRPYLDPSLVANLNTKVAATRYPPGQKAINWNFLINFLATGQPLFISTHLQSTEGEQIVDKNLPQKVIFSLSSKV